MKTLSFVLLIFVFVLNSNAQITLEKTFIATSIDTQSFVYAFKEVNENTQNSNVLKYSLFDSRDTNKLKLFNLDHSIYKTVVIPPVAEYSIFKTLLPTVKLFNNDDKVELLIVYSRKYNDNVEYTMVLIDEDGIILKEFGNFCNAYVITADNKFKLIVNNAFNDPIYSKYPSVYYYEVNTRIYSLPGTVPTNEQPVLKTIKVSESNTSLPYPNPSNTFIHLTYDIEYGSRSVMKIFDSSGKYIEQKELDSYFNEILLNVSTYPSGVYFYEYNGKTNKFIVN